MDLSTLSDDQLMGLYKTTAASAPPAPAVNPLAKMTDQELLSAYKAQKAQAAPTPPATASLGDKLGQMWQSPPRGPSLVGMAKNLVGGAISGATLPGDVYAGKVDPASDEAIKRSLDLALTTSLAGGPPKALVPPSIVGTTAKVAAPTVEELKTAATGPVGYKSPVFNAVELKPGATAQLADDITANLVDNKFRDYLHGGTFRAVSELKQTPGEVSTLSDVIGVRQLLGKVSGDYKESAAATQAIKQIDKYISELKTADVVAGNPTEAASTLFDANANYAAMKRGETVAKAEYLAELNARTSAKGMDTASRGQLKSILQRENKQRGFSDEELAQMQRATFGTRTGNAFRAVGDWGPTGGKAPLLLHAGTAFKSGGASLPYSAAHLVAGWAARWGANRSTAGQVARLDEMVRARSPLHQALLANTPAATKAQPLTIAQQAVLVKLLNDNQSSRSRAAEKRNPALIQALLGRYGSDDIMKRAAPALR